MFAYTLIFCPLLVTFSFPLSCSRSAFCSWSFARFSSMTFIVSSSGSMYNIPVNPSITAILPSYFVNRSSPSPITAGIFIVRARIAVCELEDPYIVAKPRTLLLSSCTVSLGARSSAAIIHGSVISFIPPDTPHKISNTRSDTSFTSAALPCI